MTENNKVFKWIFITISVLIPLLVGIFLILPKADAHEIQPWIFDLPFYNAIINTLTVVSLISGFYCIKTGKVSLHKVCMISAFLLGSLFLIFYVIYHSNVESTKFGGVGMIKNIYFFLLASHILLSFFVVPLVLFAIYFAITEKIELHKKLVKFTLPVWLYVSITGVIIYLMISPYYIH